MLVASVTANEVSPTNCHHQFPHICIRRACQVHWKRRVPRRCGGHHRKNRNFTYLSTLYEDTLISGHSTASCCASMFGNILIVSDDNAECECTSMLADVAPALCHTRVELLKQHVVSRCAKCAQQQRHISCISIRKTCVISRATPSARSALVALRIFRRSAQI